MAESVQTARSGGRRRRGGAGASVAMQIIQAAIDSILELGYYRSTTNEIARRSNLTWGAIQYHFGTRESLLLAVIHEINGRFISQLDSANVSGDTLDERLSTLYDIFARLYDSSIYLVWLQITLDLRDDPDTSKEVAAEIESVAARGEASFQRIVREAIGDEATPGEIDVVFSALRGFALGRRLGRAVAPHGDREPEREAFNGFLHALAVGFSAPESGSKGHRRVRPDE